MPRLAIISASGGTGRSTLAAALASLATRCGPEALALDWDPANALALHLGAFEPPDDGLALQAPRGREVVALQAADGTLVLPHGTLDAPTLVDLERRLVAEPDWLRARLDELPLAPDGWVFLDTPRWPSVHARQAARAADAVIVVTRADSAALDFALPLLHSFAGRRAYLVVNHFDPARALQSEVFASLHERAGEALCLHAVHRDAAVPEALAQRGTASAISPHSLAAHDLQALMHWLQMQFELVAPVQSGGDAG